MLDDILKYKPVRFFPELYNIDDFILKHPVINPETNGESYTRYWKGFTRQVIEGMWGHDYDPERNLGGYRYLPPIGTMYINAWVIDMEDDEKGKSRDLKPPRLVDIVFIHVYGMHASKGFSGFEFDTENTCLWPIHKLEKKIPLTVKDELILKKAGDSVLKEDGTYKKFVKPIDYLYRTFDKPLGRSLYHNEARNQFNIQSRRGGKTSLASCALYHEFMTYGKRYYDESYFNNPRGTNSSVFAAIKDKSEKFCKMVLDGANYLNTELGSYNGSPGWFHRSHYGSLDANDTYYHGLKITKVINKKKQHITKTSGATMTHMVATTQNPDVGAAGAQSFDVLEEFGLMKNAKKVLGALEPAQTGTLKFGWTLGIGTGGNIDKIQDTRDIMENPGAYGGNEYPDLCEGRVKPIGLFLPSYMTRFEFKDAKGNTDYERAFQMEIDIIQEQIKNGDRQKLELHLMGYPLVLSHIYLGSKVNHWPVGYIEPALRRMDIYKTNELVGVPGTLIMTNHATREVKFEPDMTGLLKPITHYNTDNYRSVEGCVMMYEPPEPGLEYEKFFPRIYFNPYKVVYDSIKDPESGDSLACIYVFKGIGRDLSLMTDTIVASYIGRLSNPNEIDQIAINLAVMYGARILYEQNINTIFQYADVMGFTDLLQPTPFDSLKQALKAPKKKGQTGIHMSAELKQKADLWGIPWLTAFKGYAENGDKRYKVDYLCCRRLLEEFLFYGEGNFDCISTFRIYIVWIQQEIMPSDEVKEQFRAEAMKNNKEYATIQDTNDTGSIWRT